MNPNQHYLGNRLRPKGVVEKCTFCIQRTREGPQPRVRGGVSRRAPACSAICSIPDSEIRWVLKNKQVFRLKEDLGTEPKFWYYMD